MNLLNAKKLWRATWPKVAAIGIVLIAWELLVLSQWRPSYVLPSPVETFASLGEMVKTEKFWQAVARTVSRAFLGFSIALLIGTSVGILVARIKGLRLAIGSLITGLQTMPSIAWFPLAILFFGITEQAILFVIVLGAAPSIANGIIAGIDHVPPSFNRLGKVLGANSVQLYRFIVIPSALPTYVSGLTQGWSFAWRSLMAGELLVIIADSPSLGAQLEFARQFSQAPVLLATMIVILILGMAVDLVFSTTSRSLRARRGMNLD